MGARRDQPGKSQTEELYDSRTAETLPESSKIFRDAFCNSYIIDFNGANALMRISHPSSERTCRVRASQLLREPYVANRIHELVRALKPSDVVQRGQVMARMWQEANDDSNPGKVRVAALAHVANMLGMTKPVEDKGPQAVGVLLIPMTQGDDWSAMAQQTQLLLKNGTAQ